MRKILYLFVVVAFVFISKTAFSSENSCIACHGKLTAPPDMVSYFKEWDGSAHAKKEVTCDKCHGGNPSAVDQKDAHVGIFKTSDPRSSLFKTKVSETCGACHVGPYATFKNSKHYELTVKEGKEGPNCVNCHGGRKNTVLSPSHMVDRCAVCHSSKGIASVDSLEKAHQVLLFVDSVGRQLKDLQNEAINLELAGKKQDKMLPIIRKASTIYYKIGDQWHNFKIDETYGLASEVNFLINSAQKEVQPPKRYLAYTIIVFVILLAGVLIYILRRRS